MRISDWSSDVCSSDLLPPRTTALGALLAHITGEADPETFQPMNINFGLFPPPDEAETITANGKRRKLKGLDRKRVQAARALTDLDAWLGRDRAAAEYLPPQAVAPHPAGLTPEERRFGKECV